MRGTQAGPDERGFTLMELLVAMTLLGLLMAALFGGLRLGTRVWEASEQTLDASSQATAIREFLRSRFEQVLPMTVTLAGGRAETVFLGEHNALRFASSMPISLGANLFLLELVLKPRQTSDRIQDLVLRWRPLDTDRSRVGGEPSERIIIEDVADLALGYFGAQGRALSPAWSTEWRNPDILPRLIRIELQFPANDRRRWPPLIVSPKVDEWYDTSN